MTRPRPWGVLLGVLVATVAEAADIPVAATRLALITRFSSFTGRVRIKYVARDPAVTKGSGLDPEQISVRFRVQYEKWHGKGEWIVPAGTANGWLANDAVAAKYRNPDAPAGPSDASGVIIKGQNLKFLARGFGATIEDIHPEFVGDPLGPVYTAACVTNGIEENCHCSVFSTCTWSETSGGLASKVICTDGTGDPDCRANCSGLVDQGLTAADTCTDLEWEKKDTALGSGQDAGNLHDVDNRYTWAGVCNLDTSVLCQPNAAAAATCAAQAGGGLGCAECGLGQGTCDAMADGAITTVWDWLNQVNAANFAGHSDWRLPTGTIGFSGTPTDPPAELASLADHVCVDRWCVGTALGPAAPRDYVTSSSSSSGSTNVITTDFQTSPFGEAIVRVRPSGNLKASGFNAVRAVRPGP